MEAAIAMTQRLEVYSAGGGAKASGKGPKKFKNQNQKKDVTAQVEGSSFGGTVQVVQVVKKPQQKKGKGSSGSDGKKTKRGGETRFNAIILVVATYCGIARSGKRSKRNFIPPQEKTSPAPLAHIYRSPGWNPWITRQ